jgi:hypothetical protein
VCWRAFDLPSAWDVHGCLRLQQASGHGKAVIRCILTTFKTVVGHSVIRESMLCLNTPPAFIIFQFHLSLIDTRVSFRKQVGQSTLSVLDTQRGEIGPSSRLSTLNLAIDYHISRQTTAGSANLGLSRGSGFSFWCPYISCHLPASP